MFRYFVMSFNILVNRVKLWQNQRTKQHDTKRDIFERKKKQRFSFELNENPFMADASRTFAKNENWNQWIEKIVDIVVGKS